MENVKPKLPRKRKKAAIKAQGRKWYFDTIRLHKITSEMGICDESVCKFWDNKSLVRDIQVVNNNPIPIHYPTRFW